MQFLGNLEATQFILNIITVVFSKCVLFRCLFEICKSKTAVGRGLLYVNTITHNCL